MTREIARAADVSPDRAEAARALSERRRTIAAAARRPVEATFDTHRGCATLASAESAVGRASGYLAQPNCSLRTRDGKWIPVAKLRPDQSWLAGPIAERGVVVEQQS